MDLNLVYILYEIRTDEPLLLLPHLYNAVRRFENYFQTASSLQNNIPSTPNREESECSPHRSVFGQILSTDPEVVRRHQKPPLPFAFKIREILPAGLCIELGIVIIGSAIQHVSIFHNAINLMMDSVGENNGANFSVSGAWFLDYQGGRHAFNADSSSLVLLSGLEILQASQHSDTVKIYFESPLRLLCAGSLSHSFDFAALLRSQLRRCSSIIAYYGEGALELDYVFMSKSAERVTSVENGFFFTKPRWTKRESMAGIMGASGFKSLADSMLPLLMLGSYLNAGKGAAYGMGVHRVEEV